MPNNATLNSAQAIFNLIRLRGTREYQDTVPALTSKSPIGDVATPILTQPLILKEFTQLLGAFIKMTVDARSWENPLAELVKSNGTPLGEYSAEVANNPVAPKAYDPLHPEKILDYAMTQDFVYYYARNVKELFELSIAYEDMKGAFQTYDAFNQYVSMKVASLESGRQLSMFNHIMESIVVNYNAGLFPVSWTRLDADNYAKWTAEVKTAIDDFAFPNTKYNRYNELAGAVGKFKAWTNPEDVYIMVTNDWINSVNVNFLASVFNISKAELANRIIKVPEFGYSIYDDVTGAEINHITTDIGCFVFDRRMLNFSSDLDIDNSFFNERTLVQNIYHHWWATYSISPFGNSLVFLKQGEDSDLPTYEFGINNPVTRHGYPSTIKFMVYGDTPATVINESGISDTDETGILTIRDSNGNVIKDITSDPNNVDATLVAAVEAGDEESIIEFLAYMFMRNISISAIVDGESAEISNNVVDVGGAESASIVYSISGNTAPTIYKPATYEAIPADESISAPAVNVTITRDMIDAIIELYGERCYLNVGGDIYLTIGTEDYGYKKEQDILTIPMFKE